jgi:hypothetical protein
MNSSLPSIVVQMAKGPSITMGTATQSIPLENRLPIKATLISLYALIFFFGISGNALVVRKYFKQNQKHLDLSIIYSCRLS